MRYPFQSTGRPMSHRNGWSFRVYMIPLRDFVPEWNSRPGTRTGVKSRRGDSCLHDILWWYHVNKYRAIRGNRSELALGRKSPRCHVNTRLVARFIEEMSYVFSFTFFFSTAHFHLALVAASTLVFQEKKSLLCLSLALDLCRPFSRWASLACHLLPLLIFCVLL